MAKGEKKKQIRIDEPTIAFYLFFLVLLIVGSYYLFLWVATYDRLGWPPEHNLEQSENSSKGRPQPHNAPGLSTKEQPSSYEHNHQEPAETYQSIPKPVRERRDIYAQEGMWRASNFVAIFTGISVFIGTLGLSLIYLTLRETRRTLDEARETTAATREASEVSIRRDSPSILFGCVCDHANAGKTHAKAIGYISNMGQTAALNAQIRASFIRRENGQFTANRSSGYLPFSIEQILPYKADDKNSRLPVGEFNIGLAEFIGTEDTRLYFVAEATYDTIFEKTLRERMIFRISPMSSELFTYRQRLKLLAADSGYRISDDELEKSAAAARDPSNISRFDIYRCNNKLADIALETIESSRREFKEKTGGVGMPNFGTPDDDEK